jgi:Clostripain family
MAKSKTQEFEWLIIFLIYNNSYYDLKNQDTKDYYTMEEQTKYILNQIRYSTYSEKVKTIFVEAEIKNKKDNPVATISFLHKKEGTWLSAVDGIWRDGESLDILTNKISLETILKKLKDKYPAKKHMVITAGHGSIVGINYYIPELIPESSRESNKEVEAIFKKNSGFISGIKFQKELLTNIELEDGKRLLFLANQEISEAFKKVFSDKKIDVMVMYNCLMQNIFTQFDFRETVDWLVAPLSGISIPGFNYGNILNKISNDPFINSEKVSELFTSSIREGNRYSSYQKDIEGTWKIAAVRMNKEILESIQYQFDILFTEINKISDASILAQTSDDVINCINETVRHLFNYGAHCLPGMDIPDIGILLEYLKIKITDEYGNLSSLLEHIENLQLVLNQQTEKHIFEGQDFYDNDIPHREDNPLLKKAVVNMGILFPFRKFDSELLNFIYKTTENSNSIVANNYTVPSFLKSWNYAAVINKILKLPQ